MRFDAVLFDADETLFNFKDSERIAIHCFFDQVGISDPEGHHIFHQINDACWKDLEKGLILQAQLKTRRFRELAAHYGLDFSEQWAADFYEQALSEQSILIAGAEEVVRQIAEVLPVAIVTNGIARVQRGRLSRSPILPHIAALAISEEVGASKPDPKMIHFALREMGGIAPERALLVGDSLTSDMQAGARAGVVNCWYNPKRMEKPEHIAIHYEIADIREAADIALK